MFGTGALTDSSRDDNSRDTSSVNTPKFHSSHSSTPQQCQTPNPQDIKREYKEEPQPSQETNQFYTQVDDFPRLVDQIKGPIAQNLLDNVVNFNGLISKLLQITFKAIMFSDSNEISSLV